jgi:N-acylneuraminate cytidylyltransferase
MTNQNTEKIVAVITARGGSKRVPGKNVRKLLGKPLIAYTIAAALESKLFDRVVVSTESNAIADIARQYGAEVPFLRDTALADDYVPASRVTVDAINRLALEGSSYRFVAQLMPNCPLRTAADVQASYRQFVDTGTDSQISVTRYGWQNPWWAMQRDGAYALTPLFASQITERSQDLPELFCPTGAVWWAKANVLLQHGTYHIEGRSGWEIPWQRGVDIDTEEDWKMAEALMCISQGMATGHGA